MIEDDKVSKDVNNLGRKVIDSEHLNLNDLYICLNFFNDGFFQRNTKTNMQSLTT